MPGATDLPRVAVLGQGSIGRRHAGILLEMGCDVVVWDPAQDAAPLSGTRSAASEEEAVAAAGAVVVASPTSHHAGQARRVMEAGRAVLVEKPLALTAAGAAPLAAHAAANGSTAAVAMNLRYHPGPRAVRDVLASGAIGRPLLARFTFGSWLPGWRPQSDFRQGYSARRELGGGVLLDVIHEIDLALWLLGPIEEVSASVTKVSDLEIDVEDLALITVAFAGGAAGSIELDYLDRSYRRGCRIVGSEATVEWDWSDERVRVLDGDGERSSVAAPSDVSVTYRAELEHFLAVAAGGDPGDLASCDDGMRALEVVDAARTSASEGRRLSLAPAR